MNGFTATVSAILIRLGVNPNLLIDPRLRPRYVQSNSKDANDIDLPTLDNTGKVHGDLPDPNDFNKVPKDKLKEFLKDLVKSVKKDRNLIVNWVPILDMLRDYNKNIN